MRILVVTSMPPAPALATGGGQRTDLLLRALEAAGEVDLFLVLQLRLVTEEQLARVAARHRLVGHAMRTLHPAAGPWRFGAGRLPGRLGETARRLAAQAGHYARDPAVAGSVDACLAARSYDLVVARYLAPALRAGLPRRRRRYKLCLDLDDLDSRVLEEQVAATSERAGWPGALSIRQLRRTVRRSLPRFDHVWLTDARDGRDLELRSSSELPNAVWAPEGAPAVQPEPASPESRELLFVATFGYEPNRFGLDRFLERVWPRVLARVPEASLRVVGTPPRDGSAARWQRVPGVAVAGFVEDLTEAYRRSAFTIAPLYWGGGPKLKVIESLARGRTCVVTPVGQAGYEETLRDGEALLRAATDADFAEACVRLLCDPALRERLATRGRAIVAERFGFDRFRQTVRRDVEALTR